MVDKMVIWFNSKKAREQLINKGVVITCRKIRKSFGTTQAVFTNDEGKREKIGYVDVQYADESWDEYRSHDTLFEEFLKISGFKTIEEWKEEVRRLNNNCWMPDYLIFLKVTMDRDIY